MNLENKKIKSLINIFSYTFPYVLNELGTPCEHILDEIIIPMNNEIEGLKKQIKDLENKLNDHLLEQNMP